MNNNLITELDNYFVDNYDNILVYKNNINDMLINMNINQFESYNDFCLLLRNISISEMKNKNIKTNNVSELFHLSINKLLLTKINTDVDYNDKILKYFNDKKLLEFIKTNKQF